MNKLTFAVLRAANRARIPQFKDCHGRTAHASVDGSDWSPAQWLQAVVGELGEYANIRKKFERGDLTFEQYAPMAAKELADVQIYLDLLAQRALDYDERTDDQQPSRIVHALGIDLGAAVVAKFNEVSVRVGATVEILDHGATWTKD